MLHGLEITIKQMVGRKKGMWVTEPIDVIYATKNGNTRKIGFVGRHEGATVLLIRHLKLEMREPIRLEVERLRREEDEPWGISNRIACPPDPKLIKAYVKGELHKKKTTIILPEGVGDDDDDDDDGEDYLEDEDDE